MKILKIFLFTFYLVQNMEVFAQTYFGLHLEPITYIASVEKVQYSPMVRNKELSLEGNIGITFSLTHITEEKIGISLRPGIMLGYVYFGYDLGLFWSYNLDSDIYIIGGLNAHLNHGRAGSNSAYGENLLLPFLVAGGGYRISKDFSAEMQFNLSLKNETYGWIRDMQYAPTYNTKWDYYKVPWLIKISLAYGCEL